MTFMYNSSILDVETTYGKQRRTTVTMS